MEFKRKIMIIKHVRREFGWKIGTQTDVKNAWKFAAEEASKLVVNM